MHCISCERLLEDEFGNIEGIEHVKINRKNNAAEIFYKNTEPDFSEIEKTAKKFGYEASAAFGHPMPKSFSGGGRLADWIKAAGITLALLFLFRIFQNTGVLNKIDIGGSEVTLGVAFLVGLVASVSSCLAVVGSVVIAFGEKYKADEKGFFGSAVKPNLMFHAGRLGTFFVLGGFLGAIGGEVSISGNFVSIFTIIIAVVMAWLGLNILGLLPAVSDLGIRMPKKFTKNWNKLKQSEHRAAPFLLGALSFFLPCGFTQSMQIFALTSGSFFSGGLSLLLFALGTVPMLMLAGVAASWTHSRKMLVFQKVAGFIIIFFAVYTLRSGLALSGVKTDVLSTGGNQQEEIGKDNGRTIAGEKQIVEMAVTARGFSPATIRIRKDAPVRWIINGDQITGCTNKIIVPSLNISKNLSYGENIVEFTPQKSGEIPFSCWMGMVRGKFIVVE